MTAKVAHLQLIQGVITRMAANSFLLKGCSVTLVSAIFALAGSTNSRPFVALAYFPAAMFWLLDAYFLRQETIYRAMYNSVASRSEEQIDFSLNAALYKAAANWWVSYMFTSTLLVFHGVIVLVILTVWLSI